MTAQFTRQTHNTSFIAYGSKPSKKPVALTLNGEATQARIHPDVFINEYTSIQVKEISEGEQTVNIKFDASTAVTGSEKKMKYDFGANLQKDSPLVGLAQQALAQSRPVYIGIETRRRFRDRSGEIIPWTTPIHVLRGCKDGPQSSGNSNDTGNNCSKVLAVIGFADEPNTTLVSDEAHSDPLKWPLVRDNQDGDLPPAGFAIPQGPNGEPVGGIIAVANTQSAPSGVSADIAKQLENLTKMVAHLQRSNSNGGGGEKPWNDRTADGSANPASYAVTQVRHTRGTAARLVATAAPEGTEAGQLRGWESELTNALLWAADQVQGKVTGGVNRMAKAHTEAGGWVSHVIEFEEPLTEALLADIEARRGWIMRVRDAAAQRYAEAVALTQEHLDAAAGVPTAKSTAEATEQAPQQPQQGQEQPTATPQQAAMFADDQEARQLWDGLIEQVGMVDYIDQLNPALTARFGTHLSAQIPAADMRAALAEWMANPQQFIQWAQQQYMAATKQAA